MSKESVKEVDDKKYIIVNDRFRIGADSMNYIVQKLHTVDPTKAPNFNPNETPSDARQVWKDEGYFGLSIKGLKAAIKRIAVLETEGRHEKDVNIKDYIKTLKECVQIIEDAVGED